MNLLQYRSNEMYSSTQLIRQSKMIFEKINSKEIDKAIILRDGKPSFMLLNFEKYEKIMIEYEELKKKESNKKSQQKEEVKEQPKVKLKKPTATKENEKMKVKKEVINVPLIVNSDDNDQNLKEFWD